MYEKLGPPAHRKVTCWALLFGWRCLGCSDRVTLRHRFCPDCGTERGEYPAMDARKDGPGVPECVVCQENRIAATIYPCRHAVACRGCVKGVAACPVCRGKVRTVHEVFIG